MDSATELGVRLQERVGHACFIPRALPVTPWLPEGRDFEYRYIILCCCEEKSLSPSAVPEVCGTSPGIAVMARAVVVRYARELAARLGCTVDQLDVVCEHLALGMWSTCSRRKRWQRVCEHKVVVGHSKGQ
jgi:hypothetical protein